MTRALKVLSCGPGVTVQDLGRFGHISSGTSAGGAADEIAVYEGAAMLGQSPAFAVLELAGMGGAFQVSEPTRIALTGSEMAPKIDDAPLLWNGSYLLKPGETLSLGPTANGNYGYLHFGGGIETPAFMGSRSTHTIARIGGPVSSGTNLPVGEDSRDTQIGLAVNPTDRFGGGTVRLVPSAQTKRFAASEIERLQSTRFSRDPRGNRMGARMSFEGDPFVADGMRSLVSEMVVPGDIQIAGDGTPFVLLGECQTTGGYPRIGTVIPPDIPRIAQARAGEELRFQMITHGEALAIHAAYRKSLEAIAPYPRLRDPHDIADLLSYQLISGAVNGEET